MLSPEILEFTTGLLSGESRIKVHDVVERVKGRFGQGTGITLAQVRRMQSDIKKYGRVRDEPIPNDYGHLFKKQMAVSWRSRRLPVSKRLEAVIEKLPERIRPFISRDHASCCKIPGVIRLAKIACIARQVGGREKREYTAAETYLSGGDGYPGEQTILCRKCEMYLTNEEHSKIVNLLWRHNPKQ